MQLRVGVDCLSIFNEDFVDCEPGSEKVAGGLYSFSLQTATPAAAGTPDNRLSAETRVWQM